MLKIREFDGDYKSLAIGECIANGYVVDFEEFKTAKSRVEKLCAGLHLTHTDHLSWYGEDYEVIGPDYGAIAILLARIS